MPTSICWMLEVDSEGNWTARRGWVRQWVRQAAKGSDRRPLTRWSSMVIFWNLLSIVIFSCGRDSSLSHSRFQISSKIAFFTLKSHFIWYRILSQIGYGDHYRLSPYTGCKLSNMECLKFYKTYKKRNWKKITFSYEYLEHSVNRYSFGDFYIKSIKK